MPMTHDRSVNVSEASGLLPIHSNLGRGISHDSDGSPGVSKGRKGLDVGHPFALVVTWEVPVMESS